MKRTLLFVNDDSLAANQAARNVLLESRGEWRVLTCINEKSLNQVLTSGKQIDAAMVDLRLRSQFDRNCWEIVSMFQERGVPVGITSANVQTYQADEARQKGIPIFQIKYYGPEEEHITYIYALERIVERSPTVNREVFL